MAESLRVPPDVPISSPILLLSCSFNLHVRAPSSVYHDGARRTFLSFISNPDSGAIVPTDDASRLNVARAVCM